MYSNYTTIDKPNHNCGVSTTSTFNNTMVRISDSQLIATFKGTSPLSRRTIRRRLKFPPNKVMSAILFDLVQRNILVRVNPPNVGSNKQELHVYKLYMY